MPLTCNIGVALPRPRYERAVDSPEFAALNGEIRELFMAQGVLQV